MKKVLYFAFVLFSMCFAAAENKTEEKIGGFQKKSEVRIIKEYTETGANIFLDESYGINGTAKYKLYNNFYGAEGAGILSREKPLFCPYGTEICIWLEYGNGLRSKARYCKVEPEKKTAPFIAVLNPKSGYFKSKQTLAINFSPGTKVTYTTDGTEPSSSGLFYTEPVLINQEGEVCLRIKAETSDGRIEETRIDYVVKEDGEDNLFNEEFLSILKEKEVENDSSFPLRILNWHFLEFDIEKEVYFSVLPFEKDFPPASQITEMYNGIVCLPRTEDCILYWTSTAWQNGKVQKLELPAKPSIAVSNNNEFLEISFSDSRYEYYYEAVKITEPFEPARSSNKCENGKHKFKITPNAQFDLNVKIKAFYGGIEHGNFETSLNVDTLPPAAPEILLFPDEAYSNKPISVSFMKDIETELSVKISPPIYYEKNGTYILTGENGKNIEYLIEAFTVDKSGNKSRVSKKKLTVERRGIFADSNAKKDNIQANGTPLKPFFSLDAVFKYLRTHLKETNNADEPITIFLKGHFKLEEAVLLTRPVILKAAPAENGEKSTEKAVIEFGKNAGFVAEKTFLHIEGCLLKRSEHKNEPRQVPIIYSSGSEIKLYDTEIFSEEGGAVLKFYGSHADINQLSVTSVQTKYCEILIMDNSSAVFSSVTFKGKGETASGFSFSNSDVQMTNIICMLEVIYAAHALEAWSSTVEIGIFECIREPEEKQNKDSAVWFNSSSRIVTKYPLAVRGFAEQMKKVER